MAVNKKPTFFSKSLRLVKATKRITSFILKDFSRLSAPGPAKPLTEIY